MPTRWTFIVAGSAIAAAGLVAACTTADRPPAGGGPKDTLAACTNPQAFPSGFDYPQQASTVEGWVAAGDAPRAQRHGWYLWAGLNHDNGNGPVWRSWCTSTQAFAPAPAAGRHHKAGAHISLKAVRSENGKTMSEDPINVAPPQYAIPASVRKRYPQCIAPTVPNQLDSLIDGPTFQSNGDVMIAGVIFSPDAFAAIRGRSLYEQSTLDALVPPSNRNAQIDAMPAGSIVLKPMLWPVQGTGYTALPIWNGQIGPDDGKYSGFEIKSKWPAAVAVTAQPTRPGQTASPTFLYGAYDSTTRQQIGPNTYANAPTASVQDFYNYQPDLASLAPCDQALLHASANWAYNRDFAPGDYLVLAAMHIMTKEQPAWTFQSVWWDKRPNNGTSSLFKPAIPASKAPGPWGNYQIASTYGILDPNAPPSRPSWPVAFNPYIELAAGHPVRTNCMNCHHRAAWPHDKSSYEAPGGPDALQAFNLLTDPVLSGMVTVDTLWSISDRALAPSAKKAEVARAGAGAAAGGKR
jgi:hypothetical protein